jgi:polysaccharide chain length determinant protein (PEP-CTERM system associated)
MQENISDFLGEVRSALRFRWYGMLAIWVICLAGWTYVTRLPDVYESSARVFVDTNSVIARVLGDDDDNVPDVQDRLAYIREALLGRVRLETVMMEAGLGGNIETERQREAMLGRLKNDIWLESSGGNNITRADNIYTIGYQSSNRDTAIAVVSTLLDTFVSDTVNESRRSGESAEQFLDERVREYERRLADAEEALATFKRENADRLPGAEGDYYDRMRAESDELADARRDLRLLQSKRTQLQSQLDEQATVVASADPSAADNLPANSLDARIRDYQTQLDLALLQYTERHPDVISLRGTLEHLKAQRDEQLAALGIEGKDLELYMLGANPVRQAIQVELNDTDVEIATLTADVEDRTERLAELQGLINELPQVEAQLQQLNRDYDVVYEQYLALVRSREAQGLTLKAADSQQAEFRVLDPPLATLDPVGPQRIPMYVAVFFVALGAGAALCYVCAQLWPVFGRARALRQAVGLPVLGTVSHAWEDRYRAETRSAELHYAAVLGVLVVMCVILVGLESAGLGLNALLLGGLS